MFIPDDGICAPFPDEWSWRSTTSKAAFTLFAQSGPTVTETTGKSSPKKFVAMTASLLLFN